MAERTGTPTEQMIAYLRTRAEKIDAAEFVQIIFHVHHGVMRRVKIEETDEFGNAGEERLSA